MKRLWALALLSGAVFSIGALSFAGKAATATGSLSNERIIAGIVETAATVNIDELPAIAAERFTLPAAGVDVMRVRMEETYTINGVGTDTVELKGWIAARHNAPRPAPGQTQVTWGTAVIDTEFVGLELSGVSKIFGPVRVRLTEGAPSVGQVGAIDVPELREKFALASANNTSALAKCAAAIQVDVEMPQLGLSMKTQQPVRMYSIVETIPPVGHTASVSLTPTPLVDGSRQVGTLNRAEVKFREIVLKSSLNAE
jgi:hypothetical protein